MNQHPALGSRDPEAPRVASIEPHDPYGRLGLAPRDRANPMDPENGTGRYASDASRKERTDLNLPASDPDLDGDGPGPGPGPWEQEPRPRPEDDDHENKEGEHGDRSPEITPKPGGNEDGNGKRGQQDARYHLEPQGARVLEGPDIVPSQTPLIPLEGMNHAPLPGSPGRPAVKGLVGAGGSGVVLGVIPPAVQKAFAVGAREGGRNKHMGPQVLGRSSMVAVPRRTHRSLSRAAQAEFDREARDYDLTAKRTMPLYSEMHRMLVWGVPHLPTRPLRVLELGVGTGNLTRPFLETFPHAHVDGVDLSPSMIAICRRKVRLWKHRVTLAVAELDRWPWKQTYDIIVSCLAIHHLPDARKRSLFRRVFAALRPGGYFGDGDDHLPEDSRFDERFTALASRLARAPGDSEFPPTLQKVWHSHELFDHPVPLSWELDWIREAGFHHVDTPWRFFNQAVVWAYR